MLASGLVAGFLKVALVAVSLGGLTAGAYYAYQIGPGGSGGDGTSVQAGASATAPLATLTPTAEPTAVPPTPTATALPTATDVPVPTPDTRVPIRDLPTADQIQLGKDGKYFIADRGDGCTWMEHGRRLSESIGLRVSLFTDCLGDFFFDFVPETGEVIFVQE